MCVRNIAGLGWPNYIFADCEYEFSKLTIVPSIIFNALLELFIFMLYSSLGLLLLLSYCCWSCLVFFCLFV